MLNLNSFTALQAIDAVDLRKEQDELDQIEARLSELASATEAGRKRSLEIGRLLNEIRERKPDGRAAADALLAGENVLVALPSEEMLREEGAALREGLAAIGREDADLRRRREDVLNACRAAIHTALTRTVETLRERAVAACNELAQAYVDARALEDAFRTPAAVRLSSQIGGPVRRLGLERQPRLLPDTLQPSPAIVEAVDRNVHRTLLKSPPSRPVRLS